MTPGLFTVQFVSGQRWLAQSFDGIHDGPGELHAAEWAHIDLDAAEWRIPGEKMKMRFDHIVPLAKQALAILNDLKSMTGHWRYILPSIRTDEPCMTEDTVNAALRNMGYEKDVMTAHGFRAMARTILDEVRGSASILSSTSWRMLSSIQTVVHITGRHICLREEK
jgi:integrase